MERRDISTLVTRIIELIECDKDEAIRFIYTAVELRLDELSQPEKSAPAKFQLPDDDDVYCDYEFGGYFDHYEL